MCVELWVEVVKNREKKDIVVKNREKKDIVVKNREKKDIFDIFE
jgi:hypothetical protein